MKTAIVLADGIKQIVLTPENDSEKQIIKLITPKDNVELAILPGRFGNERERPFTPSIQMCEGGYLRTFTDEESIMLVLTPKEKKQ